MDEFETIYIDGKKPKYEALIQVLVTKELRNEAKKTALDNDTTVSEIVRTFLESYVEEHRMKTNRTQVNKLKKVTRKKK